jgi:hypothetical protein
MTGPYHDISKQKYRDVSFTYIDVVAFKYLALTTVEQVS